jgi:hypothetical protein
LCLTQFPAKERFSLLCGAHEIEQAL